jgi:hypothetical protein
LLLRNKKAASLSFLDSNERWDNKEANKVPRRPFMIDLQLYPPLWVTISHFVPKMLGAVWRLEYDR